MEIQTIKFNGQQFQVILRDDADVSVSAEIFKHQEYRVAQEAIVGAKSAIFDIGAHVGFFTLYARALNIAAPIFAFEPEKKNFQQLQQHLKLNNILGVEAINSAVAGESGKRFLQITPDTHNHYLLAKNESKTDTMSVTAVSLKDFCKKKKIKTVDFLKMDIEGGEYEIIRALCQDGSPTVKYLMFEYHTKYAGEEKSLERQLREAGFGVQIFPSHFDKSLGFIFAHNKRV